MPRLPENRAQAIENAIVQDLEPSWGLRQAKIGFSVLSGGLISLLICGQFGLGFTDMARAVSHQMHAEMNTLVCALICGATFALFPSLILRFGLSTRLQHALLWQNTPGTFVFWYALSGALLINQGHHGQGVLEFLSWLAAALILAIGTAWITRSFRGIRAGVSAFG